VNFSNFVSYFSDPYEMATFVAGLILIISLPPYIAHTAASFRYKQRIWELEQENQELRSIFEAQLLNDQATMEAIRALTQAPEDVQDSESISGNAKTGAAGKVVDVIFS